jgi:hypothetical protein
LSDAGLGVGLHRYVQLNAPPAAVPATTTTTTTSSNNNKQQPEGHFQSQRSSPAGEGVDEEQPRDEQAAGDVKAVNHAPAAPPVSGSAMTDGGSARQSQQQQQQQQQHPQQQQVQAPAHVLRAAPNCVRSCRLQQLVDDSDKLSDSALCAFIQALTFASNGARPRGPSDQSPSPATPATGAAAGPEEVVGGRGESGVEMLTPPSLKGRLFAVHLVTVIAVRNIHRINVVWPLVGPQLLRIVESAGVQPSLIAEKAAAGLLQVALFALDVDPKTEAQLSDLDTFARSIIVAFEHLVKVCLYVCVYVCMYVCMYVCTAAIEYRRRRSIIDPQFTDESIRKR